jgi:outer membrane protein assembly factor BamB
VRGPLIAVGAIVVLLAAVVIAYVLGLGPLAPPTAARSVVFVAISRSSDEADAQEIEAIDLDAGTRELFDVGSRITALALSADRRSLYVGLDGGKIVMLDATTGSQFGAVDLGGPTVVSLVPTADGRTLFAVAVTNLQSTVVPIDLATKKASDAITLPTTAGAAIIRGGALLVPFGDPQRLQVAFIDVNTRAVTSRLALPRGSLTAPAAFRISDTRTGIVAYDGGLGGGATGLRVYVLTDPLHWTDVALQAPFPQGLNRQIGIGLQAAAAPDGTIHLCSTAGTAARRYVMGTDLKAASAGTDCGPLAGGDQILMAKRDPAQLLVLDAKSGKTVRTLPLAGVPARLVQ